MTPVIETYSQIGKVQRAIFLCLANWPLKALYNAIIASGGTRAARIVWEIKIIK